MIKVAIETAWVDTSANWTDEYASRFKDAVIDEMGSTLDRIQGITVQMNEMINNVQLSLKEFDD